MFACLEKANDFVVKKIYLLVFFLINNFYAYNNYPNFYLSPGALKKMAKLISEQPDLTTEEVDRSFLNIMHCDMEC